MPPADRAPAPIGERIRRLSPAQLALLAQRAGSSAAPLTASPVRRRVASAEPAPLSFAQERLWLLGQLAPASPAYSIPVTLPVPSRATGSSVTVGLAALVARHEILRTVFRVRDGSPVQVIRQHLPVPLARTDLRDVPLEARANRLGDLVMAKAQRPFDLAQGPLLRATLVRLSSQEQLLAIVFHHIVFDGWSVGVLQAELDALFSAPGAKDAPLPELPIQYADFALWQRQDLATPRASSLRRYWTEQLAGAPQRLELPVDRPQSSAGPAPGAVQSYPLDPSAGQLLTQLAQAEGATLFMTMLTCFAAFAFRYTGQTDLVFGSPVSGRTRQELEPLIGMFVNTLALRVRLTGTDTFRHILRSVKDVVLAAHAHQDLPFEQVVAAVSPHRIGAHNPLFNVMFALQSTAVPPGSGAPSPTWSKFDLTVTALDSPAGLWTAWEYDAGLLDHGTVTRWCAAFSRLSACMAREPDRDVRSLPLLDRASRHQRLREWNPSSPNPGTGDLSAWFERTVARSPAATAIVDGRHELNYTQLNAHADRLAGRLARHGIGPEHRVGVYMPPSHKFVTTILAIVKLGAAWVPLDPTYPARRLAFMVHDSRPELIVTTRRWAESLPRTPLAVLIADGPDESAVQGSAVQTTTPPLRSDQSLAYVMYTSGSTGRPKGVMVSYGALANHMSWMLATWPLGGHDAVLQRTPISFDASVWEIFAPLLAGARLVIAQGDARGYGWILDAVRRHGITVLQLTPSILRALLATDSMAECPSLRRLFCGGEALPAELARRVLDTSQFELCNLYGPTESTIDATSWPVRPRAFTDTDTTVPIGRPVSGVQALVLDSGLNPVPIGVAGELCLAGDGLARGYLGDPRLTAERFVPSSFGPEPGARMYRTGDVARYRKDGALEYLGRRDRQVKVAGVRIELGEIESLLLQHERVRSCAVVADPDAHQSPRMVAYVVTDGPPVPVDELRAFLLAALPDHMVPSAFIDMDALPLSPTGKLDGAALPKPGAERPTLTQAYEAPGGEVQLRLASIWKSLLSLDDIGAGDDFFALGGHSLLATQVISRVLDTFGVEVPLSHLFADPTIRGLAAGIDLALGEHANQDESRGRLTHHVMGLSDAEVDTLLLELAAPRPGAPDVPATVRK